jgi:hypothetical protein
LNAPSPTTVTALLRVTVPKLEHESKAPSPTLVMDEPTVTVSKFVQSLNRLALMLPLVLDVKITYLLLRQQLLLLSTSHANNVDDDVGARVGDFVGNLIMTIIMMTMMITTMVMMMMIPDDDNNGSTTFSRYPLISSSILIRSY